MTRLRRFWGFEESGASVEEQGERPEAGKKGEEGRPAYDNLIASA